MAAQHGMVDVDEGGDPLVTNEVGCSRMGVAL